MTQKENMQPFAEFATLTDAELMEISGGKRHWWDIFDRDMTQFLQGVVK